VRTEIAELLIAPEGIEIRSAYHASGKTSDLLIAPEGIEMA